MGLARRLVLQAELEALLEPDPRVENPENHVSFQPDENSQLAYPHIVYSRDPAYSAKADNIGYRRMDRYKITYIDRKPDNPVFDVLDERPYCSHTTSFATDGLNHDVFDLYH